MFRSSEDKLELRRTIKRIVNKIDIASRIFFHSENLRVNLKYFIRYFDERLRLRKNWKIKDMISPDFKGKVHLLHPNLKLPKYRIG